MPWSREFYRRERLAQYQNFVRARRSAAAARATQPLPRRCPLPRGSTARRALTRPRLRRQVNCPDIPHDSLEQECAGVAGGARVVDFRHSARSPRCTVVRSDVPAVFLSHY